MQSGLRTGSVLRAVFTADPDSHEIKDTLHRINPFPNQPAPSQDLDSKLAEFGGAVYHHLFHPDDIVRQCEIKGRAHMNRQSNLRIEAYVYGELLDRALGYDFLTTTKMLARHLELPEDQVQLSLIPLAAKIGAILDLPLIHLKDERCSYKDTISSIRRAVGTFRQWIETINQDTLAQRILNELPTPEEAQKLRDEVLPKDNPFEPFARKFYPHMKDLGFRLVTQVLPNVRTITRIEAASNYEGTISQFIDDLWSLADAPEETRSLVKYLYSYILGQIIEPELDKLLSLGTDGAFSSQLLTTSHLALLHEYMAPILKLLRETSDPAQRKLIHIVGIRSEPEQIKDIKATFELILSQDPSLASILPSVFESIEPANYFTAMELLLSRPSLGHCLKDTLQRSASLDEIAQFFQRLTDLEPKGVHLDNELQALIKQEKDPKKSGAIFAWFVRNRNEVATLVFKLDLQTLDQLLLVCFSAHESVSVLKEVTLLAEGGDWELIPKFISAIEAEPNASTKRCKEIANGLRSSAQVPAATPITSQMEVAALAPVQTMTEPEYVSAFRTRLSFVNRSARSLFDIHLSEFQNSERFQVLLSDPKLSFAYRAILSTQEFEKVKALEAVLRDASNGNYIERLGSVLLEDADEFTNQREIVTNRGIPSDLGPIQNGQAAYLIGNYNTAAKEQFFETLRARGYRAHALHIYSPDEVSNIQRFPRGATVICQIGQGHPSFGYVKVRARKCNGVTMCHLDQSGQDAVQELLDILFPASNGSQH